MKITPLAGILVWLCCILSGPALVAQNTWKFWTKSPVPLCAFANPAPGVYYGAADSFFYRSTDSGKTWKKILIHDSALGFTAHSLTFPTARAGYLISNHVRRNRNACFFSNDSGKTWRKVIPYVPKGAQLLRIEFADHLYGHIVYRYKLEDYIYFTSLGVDIPSNLAITWYMKKGFFDAGCSKDGRLLYAAATVSMDKGRYYTNMAKVTRPLSTMSQVPGDFWLISYFSRPYGALLTSKCQIYTTVDTGITWTAAKGKIPLPLDTLPFLGHMKRMCYSTPRDCYLVGYSGIVLHSSDSFQTWNKESLPDTTVDIEDIHWGADSAYFLQTSDCRILIREKQSVHTNADIAGRLEKLLQLFPQPAGENLTIMLPEKVAYCSWRITDLHGLEVMSSGAHQVDGVQISIPLEALPGGMYIFSCQTKAGPSWTGKFIKE